MPFFAFKKATSLTKLSAMAFYVNTMYDTFYKIRKFSLFLLLLATLTPVVYAQTKEIFTSYIYSKTPQYYQQSGASRQDISGSAWDGNRILFV